MTNLRTANPSDLVAILKLRDSVEQWLDERENEQFQDEDFAARAREHIKQLVLDKRFVVLEDEADRMLAVGALVPPDMDFWHESDDLDSAWYIGRLMVAEHGRDYGAQLLDLMALAAACDGRKYLRLDCWRSNIELQAYYLARGFEHVRTVEHPQRLSGALFQRDATVELPLPWDDMQSA